MKFWKIQTKGGLYQVKVKPGNKRNSGIYYISCNNTNKIFMTDRSELGALFLYQNGVDSFLNNVRARKELKHEYTRFTRVS